MSKIDRENFLIDAITNSIKFQTEHEESKILDMLTEDALWKECSTLLKEFFNSNFLLEIKDNKILLFRLYKLYLLHSLSQSVKSVDENIPAGMKKKHHTGQNQNGTDDVLSMDSESSEDEGAYDQGAGAFKQKMAGFIRLLQEILNPTEKDSLELDSVFQLKALVKSFYEKKDTLSNELVETLYAMMSERPQILETKKKYFF